MFCRVGIPLGTRNVHGKCVNNVNAHALALWDWCEYTPFIYNVNIGGKLVKIVLVLMLLYKECSSPKVSMTRRSMDKNSTGLHSLTGGS